MTALPRPLPVLGYALRFAREPLPLVEAMRSAGDVVIFRLGPQRVYWVNRPDLARRVLTEASAYEKGMQADKLRVVVGDGLVTSVGEYHLRHPATGAAGVSPQPHRSVRTHHARVRGRRGRRVAGGPTDRGRPAVR